jgi:hypothetical protein
MSATMMLAWLGAHVLIVGVFLVRRLVREVLFK